MLAALHNFLTKAPSPIDGKELWRLVFFAEEPAEHRVDRYMQRKMGETRQVQAVLDGCRPDGDARERLLISMRLMYGYCSKDADLQAAFKAFSDLTAVDKTGLSHCYLGAFYRAGWAGPADLERTEQLFREGAALGDPLCMANLGLMMHKGSPKLRNLPEAMRLFRASAALGCPHGANNAAVLLLEKNFDDPVGLAFLRQAADHEETDACYSCFLLMKEKQPHEAARYLLKSRDLSVTHGDLISPIQQDLKTLVKRNRDALVPYGYWEPQWNVHQWVSPDIWSEMQLVLLMRNRRDTFMRMLPRDLVLDICFWLCTFPRPEPPKKGDIDNDELSELFGRLVKEEEWS